MLCAETPAFIETDPLFSFSGSLVDVSCLNLNKLQEVYFIKTSKFLLIGYSKICVKLRGKILNCRKMKIVDIGKKIGGRGGWLPFFRCLKILIVSGLSVFQKRTDCESHSQ